MNRMITQITIKNFGLIDNISIEFIKGLNILTGETGAGKSILIDGLRFGLGEKLSAALIRNPQNPCTVELVMDINPELLREYPAISDLAADEDALIINRTHLPDGKTKIRINGLAVTLSQLKELGDHLIDFHGPNDHQMLLSNSSHQAILDRLCDMDKDAKAYADTFTRYISLKKERAELQSLSQTRQHDVEMLEHEIKELSLVPLDETKYGELVEKQTKLNNASKLFDAAKLMLEAIDHEDTGVTDSLATAFTHVKTLNRIDSGTERFSDSLTNLQETTAELSKELRDYLNSLSFEPGEAAQINRMYDIYDDIKRKYGPTLQKAAAYLSQIKDKYGRIANLEENTKALDEQINAIEQELRKAAGALTRERLKKAQALKRTIEQELKELGILHVQFECRIEEVEFNSKGSDKVTFYLSPNAGEDLKPLADIVSSGEAARLMLALKKALINVDPIPVLIFDEIDAQIGGRLGTITGAKLKNLSINRQVILITHLPQIASFADAHFKVTKKVENRHTTTQITQLTQDEKIKELAKMMSGENETDIALTHAKEMVLTASKTTKKK
jgi:DNA repair protein RecN (Recombination protein N)